MSTHPVIFVAWGEINVTHFTHTTLIFLAREKVNVMIHMCTDKPPISWANRWGPPRSGTHLCGCLHLRYWHPLSGRGILHPVPTQCTWEAWPYLLCWSTQCCSDYYKVGSRGCKWVTLHGDSAMAVVIFQAGKGRDVFVLNRSCSSVRYMNWYWLSPSHTGRKLNKHRL